MLDIEAPSVDSARMRRAGRELLSLALMDSRNHTLRWIGAFEQALSTPELDVPQANDLSPPLWELGHLGWFQERWIARNVQRQRGARCDPSQARLPSILSDADRCFDPAEVSHAARWRVDLPELQATRQYLVDTLETTLELLEPALRPLAMAGAAGCRVASTLLLILAACAKKKKSDDFQNFGGVAYNAAPKTIINSLGLNIAVQAIDINYDGKMDGLYICRTGGIKQDIIAPTAALTGGTGYTNSPTVTITGTSCTTQPAAVAVVANGRVERLAITNPGAGDRKSVV